MSNINTISITSTVKNKQPKFAAGDCKFGTIGKDSNGDLWMWTDYGRIVNLKTGFTQDKSYIEGFRVTSLEPFTTLMLSANEDQ